MSSDRENIQDANEEEAAQLSGTSEAESASYAEEGGTSGPAESDPPIIVTGGGAT